MNGSAPCPDLVCFDLGGVLVRLAPSWDDACALAGVAARGAPGGSYAAELARDHTAGRVSDREWAERHAREGGLYDVDELLRIHAVWILGEYAGVADVVARLRSRRIATACLSNTTEGHWCRMVHGDDGVPRSGSPEFPTVASLDWRLASHRLGLAKPDPAIYAAFEEHTGYAGSRILLFDDTAANVEAARRFGWQAERIDPSTETAPQLAAHLERYLVL